MDQLLREVDEDVRRERIQNLWRNFGRHTIYITLGIILLTTGFVIWRNHEQAKLQQATDILLQAQDFIDNENYKAATALLEKNIPNIQGELQSLANLWLLQLYLNNGDADKAKQLTTTSLAATSNTIYSDFAYILSPFKQEAPKAQSPFYVLKQEKYAVDLLKEQKKLDAIEALRTLEQGLEMPASIHNRINLLLLDLEGNTPTKPSTPPANNLPTTPPAP